MLQDRFQCQLPKVHKPNENKLVKKIKYSNLKLSMRNSIVYATGYKTVGLN